MPREFTATTTEDLLSFPVHDQWAILDALGLSDAGELALPMLIEDEITPIAHWWRFLHYAYRVPRRRAELRVANVLDYEVQDNAQIGGMDVIGISVRGETVIVEGIQPVVIRARVLAPLVTLAVSDEVVDFLVYSVWFTRLFFSRRRVA